MRTLYDTIKRARDLACEEEADQIVGRIQGEWTIANAEEADRRAQMSEPRFLVHSWGVDEVHFKLGEITKDWGLPNQT